MNAGAVLPRRPRATDPPIVAYGLTARRITMLCGRCPCCGAMYDERNAMIVDDSINAHGQRVVQVLMPIRHASDCIVMLPAVEAAIFEG